MDYVIFVLLVLFKRGDKRILPTSLDYMLSQMFVLYGHAMENIHMSNHTEVIITTPVKKHLISFSSICRDRDPKATNVLHPVPSSAFLSETVHFLINPVVSISFCYEPLTPRTHSFT